MWPWHTHAHSFTITATSLWLYSCQCQSLITGSVIQAACSLAFHPLSLNVGATDVLGQDNALQQLAQEFRYLTAAAQITGPPHVALCIHEPLSLSAAQVPGTREAPPPSITAENHHCSWLSKQSTAIAALEKLKSHKSDKTLGNS